MRQAGRIVNALLIAAVLSACTSTTHVSEGQNASVTQLNERGRTGHGTIRFKNAEILSVEGVRFDGDSLLFMPTSTPGGRGSVFRDDVERVEFRSRGAGALEGLGLGVGIGFVGGFVWGALAAHEDCVGFLDINCGSPSSVGFGYAVLNGILGAVVGPIIGAAVGKKRLFVMH